MKFLSSLSTIPDPAIPGNTITSSITPGSVQVSLISPQILQAISIIGLVVLVITGDGPDRSMVINALIAIAIGNALVGGAIGVAHTVTLASVQRASIAGRTTVAVKDTVPPTITPPLVTPPSV